MSSDAGGDVALPTPAAAPAGDGSGPTADAVAAAVRAVPGVSDLHGGALGEVATYLPGRRVAGVRLPEPDSPDAGAEVHIVLAWDSPALATADAVRTTVEELVPGPVHVVVEDVTTPTPTTHDSETKDLK